MPPACARVPEGLLYFWVLQGWCLITAERSFKWMDDSLMLICVCNKSDYSLKTTTLSGKWNSLIICIHAPTHSSTHTHAHRSCSFFKQSIYVAFCIFPKVQYTCKWMFTTLVPIQKLTQRSHTYDHINIRCVFDAVFLSRSTIAVNYIYRIFLLFKCLQEWMVTEDTFWKFGNLALIY